MSAQLIIASMPGKVSCQETKEDAESYYRLGKAYYDRGKFKEAEEYFEKAVNILSKLEEKKQEAAPPVPSKPAVRQPKRPAMQYLVGDEDELHISVWQNPDLETDAIVRPDGMISFPLVGDIEASGRTISELTADLTASLSEYVREPQVSVSIKKIGGKRVIVLGQVAHPGVINVGGAMKVMDAIGMAGGFTRDAVITSAVVIRGGFQGAKAQKLNLAKVLKGDLRENIALQSQDIIFVPRKFISDMNYFLEQILDPLSRGVYISREVSEW